MIRLSCLLTAALGLLLVVAPASADTVYSWKDADGQLHFSNRVERVPPGAKVASPPPLGRLGIRRLRPLPPPPAARRRRSPEPAACGPGDATGVAAAIAERLDRRDDLVVLVGGVPVPVRETRWSSTYVAGGDRHWSELEQGAVAFPEATGCPARPPLPRYPVRSRSDPNGLCGDYRRAFAQVGVAVGRDGPVATGFREIAEMYEAMIDNDYTTFQAPAEIQFLYEAAEEARPYGVQWTSDQMPGVRLPDWLVEAHAAQTDELGHETDAYVDELTVALEEIDRAARAAGCW